MMNRVEAKEMAKYLVMGVDHFETGKEKRDFARRVLERYSVVEKEQSASKEEGGIESSSAEEDEREM